MRAPRYSLELFLGLLFVCQLAIVGILFGVDDGSGYFSILSVLLGLDLVLIGAGLVIVCRMGRQSALDRHESLARWVDDIDVTADHWPAFSESKAKPFVSTAVQALVGRLHDYRSKLLIRHQRIQRLLRNVTDVLYHADRDGRLTWVTDSVSDMLGYSPAELLGYPLEKLLADPETDLPILTRSENTARHPTRVYRRDGGIAWLLISARRIDDADGHINGTEGICRDGTRLIKIQRQLDRAKERAQVTLAAIGDGVITTGATGTVDYVNPRGEDMLSRRLNQIRGRAFENVCRLYDATRQEFVGGLVAECLETGASREWANTLALVGDETPRQPDNDYRSVTVTVSAVRDTDHQIVGAVVVLHDVTRLERVSQQLTYQANHDSLTGLLNRRAFENELRNLLEVSRHNETRHTLCYMDLDQFKLINDSCGHHAGDAMLRQLSSQMTTQLRPGDTLARLGGDEFGIIFQNIDLETAQAAAERLRHWLESFRFRWEDKTFRLGASLGLSIIGDRCISATELMRRADTACYLAKEQGRNQVRIYQRDSDEAKMRDYEVERMQLITESLDNHDFVLHAQPIHPLVASSPKNLMGVELLLRMKTEHSQFSPQDILLTAERYSMASRIDRWVIEHALQLIAKHDASCPQITCYSINISGQSITDEQFVGFLRECIDRSSVDPHRLVFEITETAVVTNLKRAADMMRSLRQIGCRFALDDFGSGVSSFGYLKHLPSDFVKIDGKLVDHIAGDPVEYSIIEALSKVCQAVGLQTVAEHVETQEQLDALERIGINHVQGYYLARPMPLEQLVSQLSAAI